MSYRLMTIVQDDTCTENGWTVIDYDTIRTVSGEACPEELYQACHTIAKEAREKTVSLLAYPARDRVLEILQARHAQLVIHGNDKDESCVASVVYEGHVRLAEADVIMVTLDDDRCSDQIVSTESSLTLNGRYCSLRY